MGRRTYRYPVEDYRDPKAGEVGQRVLEVLVRYVAYLLRVAVRRHLREAKIRLNLEKAML